MAPMKKRFASASREISFEEEEKKTQTSPSSN
jgi:hypothetical protein